MTLIKGFIGCNFLLLPKGYMNGGLLFTALMMIFSCVLTTICSLNILEVRKTTQIKSLPEIGHHLYGKPGKVISEIFVIASQASFTLSMIYYLKETTH